MAGKAKLTPQEKAAREKPARATTSTSPEAEAQRGAALAFYDYNGGTKNAIAYTAKILNIPRKTLSGWVNARGKGVEARETARALVKGVIVEHVEDAIIRILARTERAAEVAAEAGKVQQIVVSAAILQDKRADLLGLPVRRYNTDTAGQQPGVPMPAGTLADTPVALTGAAQYESTIVAILADAEKEKRQMTREEAIEQIIRFKPEAAKVLQFKPAEPEKKTG